MNKKRKLVKSGVVSVVLLANLLIGASSVAVETKYLTTDVALTVIVIADAIESFLELRK